MEAARKLRNELLEAASKINGQDADQLRFHDGLISGSSETVLPDLLEMTGVDELSASSEFGMSQSTFASGAHLYAILLDLETGKISVKRYVAVDDAG